MMFAPTASQMLRDDQRLRDLHRETVKRRKRFRAKQQRIKVEEENRRINALNQRRKHRNRHLSTLRKNRAPTNYGNNQPIRVQRTKISKIDRNSDEISTFVVPVCDQLPSPKKSVRKKKRTTKKLIKSSHKIIQKNPSIELTETKNEKEEFELFENAMSDQLSVAELDTFDRKHFGIQQSIQYKTSETLIKKESNQNSYSVLTNSTNINHLLSRAQNGYQQLFTKNIKYKKEQKSENNNVSAVSVSMKKSIKGSLFNINDIDMKTPEDNDSVKINPKDSIDFPKHAFSTVYSKNLLPLQSVLGNKKRKLKPLKTNVSCHSNQLPYQFRKNKNQKYLGNHINNYGIKLPRLTESILKEKDRMELKSPKSTFSVPIWNGIQQRRNATTIIDDFFTKMSDEFVHTHRNSNNTLFLPNINRSKLKSKKAKGVQRRTAYSVISEYDMSKEEKKLEKSLLKINETLSNLAMNERNYQSSKPIIKRRNRVKYPNYINRRKVNSNIPKKIKVKRSPTFKASRRRKRWNI